MRRTLELVTSPISFLGLGFFQYLGGKKNGPYAVSKEVLTEEILALNDDAKPYRILRGEETDLVAEWKIVDASWYGVFGKHKLKKAYRAFLLLDEDRHSVRCFEVMGSVRWSAGVDGPTPSVRYGKNGFSGRILFQKSCGAGSGLNNPMSPKLAKVYEYKFDVEEIRAPIRATVLENDWEWIPVTARRHATTRKEPKTAVVPRLDLCFCTQCGGRMLKMDDYCGECGEKADKD